MNNNSPDCHYIAAVLAERTVRYNDAIPPPTGNLNAIRQKIEERVFELYKNQGDDLRLCWIQARAEWLKEYLKPFLPPEIHPQPAKHD